MNNRNNQISNAKCQTQKGITLIALIITVIVLLILAGTAVGIAINGGDIFGKTSQARENWNIAVSKEEQEINNVLNILNQMSFEKPSFKAKGNGDLSEGTGTEENPILIQSIEDLVTLCNNVSPVGGAVSGVTYNNYSGKCFKFETNLDFQSEESYLNPQSTSFGDLNSNGDIEPLITEMTTGRGFRPIGKWDYTFNGIIDGNNKILKNLRMITASSENNGFIGMNGGSNSVVKNLTLENINISSSSQNTYEMSGLIARAKASKTTVENCKVTGTLSNCCFSGGLIGCADESSSEIVLLNNVSQINITNGHSRVGGIAGYLKGKITLTNNIYTGNSITASSDGQIGGIVGFVEIYSPSTMSGCYSTGTITGRSSCGGLIGQVATGELTVTNCYNTGNINGAGSYCGGLFGEFYNASGSITNCYNTGDVANTGTNNYVGGITSRICNTFSITNCYNTGNISGMGITGGIAGVDTNSQATITKCYNTGIITGNGTSTYNSQLGGILGYSAGGGNSIINCCYNSGALEGQNCSSVGGILGEGNARITNCYNTATVKGTYCIGGIAGYLGGSSSLIENCYNSGEDVIIAGNQCGGIGRICRKHNKKII